MWKSTNFDAEKVIIYTDQERVWCMGADLDHPKVYYTVPKTGFVVCGYCDIRFTRDEQYKVSS